MATPVRWRVRQTFWSRWHPFRYARNKPQVIGAPNLKGGRVDLQPIGDTYPRIPLRQVQGFAKLPRDESNVLVRGFIGTGLVLLRWIPPMEDGLPEIDPDIDRALDRALPRRYRQRYRPPVLPDICQGQEAPDLADLAVESPLAILLQRGDDGVLRWDLADLGDFEHHTGLCSLAVRVVFDEVPDDRPGATDGATRLVATEIHSDEFGRVVRGDDGWDRSRELAICAATTYVALVRHHIAVHLVGGDHWAVVTRNELPSDHPVFRLLWPFIFNALYTQYGTTRVQLLPEGDFANVYSFTHAGLMELYDSYYPRYDARVTDPDTDWSRRGLDDVSFDCPSQDNLREIFGILHDFTLRYIEVYYPSDEALRADEDVSRWLRQLDATIPNGVGGLVEGIDDGSVTRAGLARLIATHAYENSTVHDLVGTSLWDYQLWADRHPTRVARDGRRLPLDVFQRMVDTNFALQIRRAKMLDDYGAVALDERGAAAFTRLFDDLTALQARYDAEPAGPWRMEPRHLEINMNA